MKKIHTLLLCVALSLGSINNAFAIDFKARGEWIMSFDLGSGSQGASATRGGHNIYGYGSNTVPTASPDTFNANQRIRLQLEAIASESLSGTVFFEMGESKWGHAATGAALGADRTIVEIKHAYLDWVIPSTEVKVRMGIQWLALPSFTTGGSMVLNNDAAGIVVSNKFNENVSLTAFWARPYNDNFYNSYAENQGFIDDSSNFLDNVDIFGLSMPLSFEGFNIIPWVSYMAVGKNFARSGGDLGNSIGTVRYGLTPEDWIGRTALSSMSSTNNDDLYPYAHVWHAGLTGELTMTDPLRIAWDLNYGHADFGSINNDLHGNYSVKRQGFYASLLLEYKMDFAIPGIYGWYSSGDDDDPFNGSERMPSISNANAHVDYSHFASSGAVSIGRESVLGTNLIGTWGLGIRLKDISFVEDLKHTLRVNYIQGTNNTNMAQYVMIDGLQADGNIQNSPTGYYRGPLNGFYLTTADYAMEFGITTDYQIFENLNLNIEMAYLALHLDQGNDVWGDNFTATDAWNINASFIYSF